MKHSISVKPLVSSLALGLSLFALDLQAQAPVYPDVRLEEDTTIAPVDILEDIPLIVEEEVYIPIEPNELVQDRLSCLDTEIELTYNNVVRGFIDYFTIRNRQYTETMIRRRDIYFPIFEEYLKKHNMPDEIKYLSIVESGLNPKAASRVGAVGLWQFMPATGRELRLHQDYYIDERMDPYKATEAACKYLKTLYDMFGDWQLALASYNCGPGNVRRAIRKANHKQTFWEVYKYLPRETRSYVPQFIAVAYAMNYAKEHNFNPDSIMVPMAHDTIIVNDYLNLEVLAQQLEANIEDIRFLNPELKRNAIPKYRKDYVLKIPAEKKLLFDENRLAILDSASKKTVVEPEILLASETSGRSTVNKKIVYTVRRGDALSVIANKHGVTVAQLKSWNSLRSNSIRSGQKLAIYKKVPATQPLLAKSTTKVNTSASSVSKKTESKVEKYYKVQPGDTLWLISQKFEGLTVQQIKKMNNMKGNNIKPGMKLIIG
jgi:membrane-bound lytic murein transglycosylase D